MWKYKLRSLLTYLIYNAILLTVSYFLNRFFQMLMFILLFVFIQNCFNYRFHADTIIDDPIKSTRVCKVITVLVEILYLIICKDLDISLYSNLIVIFLIAFINCLLEFALEHFIIKTDDLRDERKLLELCKQAKLTKSATDRMVNKYIKNKTYKEIADEECVDITTIKKSINRSRNQIFKG